MAVVNRNASIEFIVKPKQDLYLEGPLRRLPRVTKGESYPCQMQKNQTFSCLFRHYAKHNGLCKDDLVFSFVDELQPEQTPETVHLMPQDEIWVEHRTRKEAAEKEELPPAILTYAEQFRGVLESGAHADVKFILGEDKVEIAAHRVILCARSQYFQAMLREGNSMCESAQGIVRTHHEPSVFRRMLEFIYTNNVRDIATVPASDLIALLMLANEYLLDDLRKVCEVAAVRIIAADNISRLLLLAAGHNSSGLREACLDYVRQNRQLLAQDAAFRQDVELNPELGLLLFESSLPKRAISGDGVDSDWAGSSSDGPGGKRRRIADQNSENELEAMPPALAPTALGTATAAAITAPALHAAVLPETAVLAQSTPAVPAAQPPV